CVLQSLAGHHRHVRRRLADELGALGWKENANRFRDLPGLDCLPEVGDDRLRHLPDLAKQVNLAEVDVMTRNILLQVRGDERNRQRKAEDAAVPALARQSAVDGIVEFTDVHVRNLTYAVGKLLDFLSGQPWGGDASPRSIVRQ